MIILCGCAFVTDKGRFNDVKYVEGNSCKTNKKVIVYIKDIEGRLPYYFGTLDSYYKITQKALSDSGCFSEIQLLKFPISEYENDVIYLDLSFKNSSGFIPVLTPVLGIAIPMPYDSNISLSYIIH
jgi:hypothetical protein